MIIFLIEEKMKGDTIIMPKLFAIAAGSDVFAVVKAETKNEAFDLFAESQINDETFREEVDNFAVNASLLEHFYLDDKGSFFDSYTGSYRKDLLSLHENDRENYVNRCIEENAKRFWDDAPQFAEEYLSELFREDETECVERAFSNEFYIDTFKRIVKQGRWYDDFEICEINLSEEPLKIIYKS